MSPIVTVDISEFNPLVDDHYPDHWIIFRVFDGQHIDTHFASNLAWAKKAKAAGRIMDYSIYFVYEPGDATMARLDSCGVPRDCVLEIDVESWGGRIRGDHSPELNTLAEACAARNGGHDRVWGYANKSDLAEIWANRPAWLGVIVASYGGAAPTGVANMIGWQYTNGRYTVASLPNSTAPLGPVDHNVLYLSEAALGGGTPLGGLFMSLTDAEQKEVLDAARATNARLAKFDKEYYEIDSLILPAEASAAQRLLALSQGNAALSGQIDGLLTALKQVNGGGTVDLAAVTAAAKAGATAALANLTLKAQPGGTT
jgi:hypothetical protein